MINEAFPDTIAKLCFAKFDALPKTGKPHQNQWTVLSCIVEELNNKFDVVALGTGSKCIGKDKLSRKGDITNDSHGEVICRRAFLLYLYEQMKDDKGILCFDNSTKKFHVLSGVRFHFFTTHVPCGDAAIFHKNVPENHGISIPQDCEEFEEPEAKKMKQDIYRTGAKCLQTDLRQDSNLEGTDYHITGPVRTKPGRGVQTLSVSCSDKLSRWCHTGLQGALLSIFLECPIYFCSFTIAAGTPFCKEALERALYTRLSPFELPKPYTQHRVIVNRSRMDFKFSKTSQKLVCPSSINWYKSEKSNITEVSVDGFKQGLTKKQIEKGVGRLRISKVELLKQFLNIAERFEINFTVLKNLTYNEAKNQATEYCNAWRILKKQYGSWTKKDPGLLDFRC